MDALTIGTMIKRRREEKQLTQAELAARLHVSDKAVSKWETGKGYPDLTLWEPLAELLGLSAGELLTGHAVTNRNRSLNMLRSRLYVCPVCGNVIFSAGEAAISCCGMTLPPSEAEEPDETHRLVLTPTEDEYYITAPHEMTKTHYLSFVAAVTDNGIQLIKWYPEGAAEARIKRGRVRRLYTYCNRHGLFVQTL